MPRSVKKGPFIDPHLEKKIDENNKDVMNRKLIKTWSRRSLVTPDFVGNTVAIYNGKKFLPVFISEQMVGHKLGEFAATRTFKGHPGTKAERATKKK